MMRQLERDLRSEGKRGWRLAWPVACILLVGGPSWFLLGPLVFGQQQPILGNVLIDGISHSTMRVTWELGAPAAFHRIRYGTSSGYESSLYGGIQPVQAGSTRIVQGVISGLRPNTLYHLCAQSSSDRRAWSACANASSSTLPEPEVHPALPAAPATMDLTLPPTTGYSVVRVESDCSNLQSTMQQAESARKTTGAILVLPPNCDIADLFLPAASDAIPFPPSSVNVEEATIQINAHGFAEDDRIRFASDWRDGQPPLGLEKTYRYYACNVTEDSFRLCNGPNGANPVVLRSAGSRTQSVINLTRQSTKWVLVVPEWPLGQAFTVEPGRRVTPEATGMARLTLTKPDTQGQRHTGLFLVNGLHHWRFIGIELTTAQTPEDPATTTDPFPYGKLAIIDFDTDHIIWDRSYLHGQGFPSRITHGVYAGGSNIAMVDSDMSNLDFWKAGVLQGLLPTIEQGGRELRISPGVYGLGVRSCRLNSPATVTLNEVSGTGKALVYLDMACGLQVVAPNGASATCSNCTFLTSSTPAYPLNNYGNLAAGPLAEVNVSSSAWTAITESYRPPNVPLTRHAQFEGPTGFLALCGGGRGPYMLINNRFEVGSIAVHFEDSCTAAQFANPGTDHTVQRNLFTYRNSWIPTDPAYDQRIRKTRNQLEWKQGQRILIDANTFENHWSSITPQGYPLVITPTKGADQFTGTAGTPITDIAITNNVFRRSSAGIQIIGGVTGRAGVAPATLRVNIENNLIMTTPNMYDPSFKDGTTVFGVALNTWGGMEDVVINHNTIVADGRSPVFWLHLQTPVEGFQLNNGIYVVSDPANWLGARFVIEESTRPACLESTLAGKSLLDCILTNGAGNPSYSFEANVLVPWKGADAVRWHSAFAGLQSTVECGGNCQGSTDSQRKSSIGFATSVEEWMLMLDPSSPYRNRAKDQTDPGVDWRKLLTAHRQSNQIPALAEPSSLPAQPLNPPVR